jgi:hypothetical protein
MRAIQEIRTTTSKVVEITCDICGKVIDVEEDPFEAQEVISITHDCGYGSVFGDGNVVTLDACQNCFKNHFGKYIKIHETNSF